MDPNSPANDGLGEHTEWYRPHPHLEQARTSHEATEKSQEDLVSHSYNGSKTEENFYDSIIIGQNLAKNTDHWLSKYPFQIKYAKSAMTHMRLAQICSQIWHAGWIMDSCHMYSNFLLVYSSSCFCDCSTQ